MKILWIRNIEHSTNRASNRLKDLIKKFRSKYPSLFSIIQISCVLAVLTFMINLVFGRFILRSVVDSKIINMSKTWEVSKDSSVEAMITKNLDEKIKGAYISPRDLKVRSDVGFVDKRVFALEDFFASHNSELVSASDEFIKVAERYEIKNWQLLPAIAIAETAGCTTGRSLEQKNCWGWGGSEPNRWEFRSFAEAIDVIGSRMKEMYGDARLNAKDIQNTYCGASCMEYGWKWARGVNFYTKQINDFGEKYNLKRTNEIEDWE